jgi:hypothetical protein
MIYTQRRLSLKHPILSSSLLTFLPKKVNERRGVSMKNIFLIFCIFLVSEYSVSDDWYDSTAQVGSASSPARKETPSTGLASGGTKDEKTKEGFSFAKLCKTSDDLKTEEALKKYNESHYSCDVNFNEIKKIVTEISGMKKMIPTKGVVTELAQAIAELSKLTGEAQKIDSQMTEIKKIDASILEQIKQCSSRGEIADRLCCEGSSPQSGQIKNLIGGVLPTLQGASSKLACSKFKNVMTTVSGLLITWNASCAGAKGYCESQCFNAHKDIKEISSKIEVYFNAINVVKQSTENYMREIIAAHKNIQLVLEKQMGEPCAKSPGVPPCLDNEMLVIYRTAYRQLSDLIQNDIPQVKTGLMKIFETTNACKTVISSIEKPLKNRSDKCEKWGADLASSLVGIGGLILQAKQKNNCGPAEEANTCNTSAPTAATCAAFCADAANKSNPACRCILNPLASGCMDGGRGVANGSGGGNFNAMNFNNQQAWVQEMILQQTRLLSLEVLALDPLEEAAAVEAEVGLAAEDLF